jgi:hypothetical protein
MPTTRIVTLNEILQLMQNFVDAHPQLKDFGYGPTSEIGTSRGMKFPYLWATHQSDSYIRIGNKTAIPELKVVLLFMDQVNDQANVNDAVGENSDNGQEIMSDTLQYLQDCITEIQINWGQYGVLIIEDVRTFPAFDETTDKVNGWAAEVTFKMTYINCEVPS